MSASNGYTGDVEGTVEVCFNNPIPSSYTPPVATATMEMKVEGLPATIAGGIHIHDGSCASQGPHYWNADGSDPWFMEASNIAPTGTSYITNDEGEGYGKFFFDNGYGLDGNAGKIVIIHGETTLTGGDYLKIACGVLVED